MDAKVPIVGVVLCLIGFILFVYGMSNMSSYAAAISSIYFIIIGVFTGLAGIFLLLMSLFPMHHTF